ncbi:MAG: hypothetical protein J0H69_12595 [Burkholderiales bacterium]|nr:hypothetical protein [Burkholderiales bacterium]
MQKPPFLSTLRRALRPAACAAALALCGLPAHAQFGALFQNIIQQQTQQAMQQQATQAAQQQLQQQAQPAARPTKQWGTPKPVPAELRTSAGTFAARTAVPELRPLFERLYIEGERNATLNFQRIGLAALSLGKLDIAERAFEAAALRIDQIYADNAEAQKAKSLWTAEKIKDYKGEPYERAMAFFYRGLVYAAQGDFQNARAMFKQADYQDTVAEAEQYAGDFALMPYMAGWASYCDGNAQLARDYLQMAVKGDPAYAGVSVEQPVLVLFESGRAPFKYGGGKHGEALKWQPHDMPAQTARAACTGHDTGCFATRFVKGADVGYQATTRGGRAIDAVLGGKASFKEGAQNVADVAGTVGNVGMQVAMQTGSRDAASLGMLGMFAGLVAQGVSASTQAQADIREWEQLPGTVWLATSATRQGTPTATVTLETAGSSVAPVPVARLVDTPSCQLYWGRSLSPLNLLRDAGPVEPGEHARDPALRQELEASYAG